MPLPEPKPWSTLRNMFLLVFLAAPLVAFMVTDHANAQMMDLKLLLYATLGAIIFSIGRAQKVGDCVPIFLVLLFGLGVYFYSVFHLTLFLNRKEEDAGMANMIGLFCSIGWFFPTALGVWLSVWGANFHIVGRDNNPV